MGMSRKRLPRCAPAQTSPDGWLAVPFPVLYSVPPAHWTTCRWPLCEHPAVPLPAVLSLCSLLFSNTQPAEGRPALNSWGRSSPPEPEPSRQDSRELPGRHCPPPHWHLTVLPSSAPRHLPAHALSVPTPVIGKYNVFVCWLTCSYSLPGRMYVPWG